MPNTPRHINQAGINLLRQWEGVRYVPYRDQAGKWTVGVGHVILSDDHYDYPLSDTDVDRLLRHDLWKAERSVDRGVTVDLTDNQYAALVCFAFNTGAMGGEHPITLERKLNTGDYTSVPTELRRWVNVHINGKLTKSNGLVNRREAEVTLWLTA